MENKKYQKVELMWGQVILETNAGEKTITAFFPNTEEIKTMPQDEFFKNYMIPYMKNEAASKVEALATTHKLLNKTKYYPIYSSYTIIIITIMLISILLI